MSGHGLDLCQGDLDVLAVEWLHALGQGQQLVRVDLEKTNNELFKDEATIFRVRLLGNVIFTESNFTRMLLIA